MRIKKNKKGFGFPPHTQQVEREYLILTVIIKPRYQPFQRYPFHILL